MTADKTATLINFHQATSQLKSSSQTRFPVYIQNIWLRFTVIYKEAWSKHYTLSGKPDERFVRAEKFEWMESIERLFKHYPTLRKEEIINDVICELKENELYLSRPPKITEFLALAAAKAKFVTNQKAASTRISERDKLLSRGVCISRERIDSWLEEGKKKSMEEHLAILEAAKEQSLREVHGENCT